MFTVYNRCLSGLYWHNERLERTTLNDLVTTVLCACPAARRVAWLLEFMTLTPRVSQVTFDMGCRRYKPFTPTTQLHSFLARTSLIGYKICQEHL
jgi:hypothetical protein